eukprot:2477777-Pleurochrysis_carterae.AAC.1
MRSGNTMTSLIPRLRLQVVTLACFATYSAAQFSMHLGFRLEGGCARAPFWTSSVSASPLCALRSPVAAPLAASTHAAWSRGCSRIAAPRPS